MLSVFVLPRPAPLAMPGPWFQAGLMRMVFFLRSWVPFRMLTWLVLMQTWPSFMRTRTWLLLLPHPPSPPRAGAGVGQGVGAETVSKEKAGSIRGETHSIRDSNMPYL